MGRGGVCGGTQCEAYLIPDAGSVMRHEKFVDTFYRWVYNFIHVRSKDDSFNA
jgi:hypothetical protein